MLKTCSKCGEDFDLLPGKKGFANVCPGCTEKPEDIARKAAEDERLSKELRAATRKNVKNRELALKVERHLDSLGFKFVPGQRFRAEVPKKAK
jgi:hypothetical protein